MRRDVAVRYERARRNRSVRDASVKANADAIMNSLNFLRPEFSVEELARPEFVADDFAAAGIESKDDIRAAFSSNFYYGCEADDRTTLWAFDPRMGFRLRPVFSSDFTHFDVPDFREVIPEAFEMVEKGFATEQDFRGFTFTNAAMLHTRNNTDSSRAWSSSKRLPMSWAYKGHRLLRVPRRVY